MEEQNNDLGQYAAIKIHEAGGIRGHH